MGVLTLEEGRWDSKTYAHDIVITVIRKLESPKFSRWDVSDLVGT